MWRILLTIRFLIIDEDCLEFQMILYIINDKFVEFLINILIFSYIVDFLDFLFIIKTFLLRE